jgi:hypothetical protein
MIGISKDQLIRLLITTHLPDAIAVNIIHKGIYHIDGLTLEYEYTLIPYDNVDDAIRTCNEINESTYCSVWQRVDNGGNFNPKEDWSCVHENT